MVSWYLGIGLSLGILTLPLFAIVLGLGCRKLRTWTPSALLPFFDCLRMPLP